LERNYANVRERLTAMISSQHGPGAGGSSSALSKKTKSKSKYVVSFLFSVLPFYFDQFLT